jgi:hypothetical protein
MCASTTPGKASRPRPSYTALARVHVDAGRDRATLPSLIAMSAVVHHVAVRAHHAHVLDQQVEFRSSFVPWVLIVEPSSLSVGAAGRRPAHHVEQEIGHRAAQAAVRRRAGRERPAARVDRHASGRRSDALGLRAGQQQQAEVEGVAEEQAAEADGATTAATPRCTSTEAACSREEPMPKFGPGDQHVAAPHAGGELRPHVSRQWRAMRPMPCFM